MGRSSALRLVLRSSCGLALVALVSSSCGDDDVAARDSGAGDTSVVIDTGAPDTSRPDMSTTPTPPPVDAGDDDASVPDDAEPPADAGSIDGGPACAPQDVLGVGMCDAEFGVFWFGGGCGSVQGCSCEGRDCGAAYESEEACMRAHAACLPGGDCETDADCAEGEQWCTGGRCVPCDNSGRLCDIGCAEGFSTYQRNGCDPCACAPISQCASDGDCGGGNHCYAGRFCWDWCPVGDPSCCLGSFCDRPGCPGDPPLACTETGCPEGQECRATERCFSSECFCSEGGAWGCTRDCIRMACMP